ncbi:GntR family transcriptional regulator [Planotetraspora silvatica]|uniref:GntR family transcriptional regulator n=1 Tax=Planotetraspora silvatica TaxID=234614 RepID=A0A8J3UT01_9ACTN|nr:GntR family transcriptional regulator [Planotetraspora silvatica]GII50777.1 GntR family transcriptional regulator [Planotetraspora silvatica]
MTAGGGLGDGAEPGQGELGVLARTSLRDEAARLIRARIITGTLVAGELYSIGSIAAQLGVSVTPVREAILDLANEELVDVVRNRGFRIRTLTDEDLDAVVSIRSMLEVPAVRDLAAARPTHDLSELRALAKETEQSAAGGDMVAFIAHDHDLHLGLLAKAGNRYLVEIVGRLRNQTRLHGLQQMMGTPDLIDSAREHELLLDAVEAGDADRAERLMAQHIRHARGMWAGLADGTGSDSG